jgi:hypothetical protein
VGGGSIIGSIGIDDKKLVGGAIHIDSTTDCIEHGDGDDCIDCEEGADGRGSRGGPGEGV